MAREPIFIDTSYAVALLDNRDAHHVVAARWALTIAQLRLPLVTSEAVFLEIGNAFAKPERWQRARVFMERLRASGEAEVYVLSEEMFARGWELRCARADKPWGLVDCTSFEIMREVGSRAALTADKHFQQAGFRALLLE